ncbi:hypothetical protein [Nostoc sp.]|uniref:hypothetical protein n=1 Tax=Nostoc sp. TaxID=1180 RepID=UPI002FF73226
MMNFTTNYKPFQRLMASLWLPKSGTLLAKADFQKSQEIANQNQQRLAVTLERLEKVIDRQTVATEKLVEFLNTRKD